MSGPVLDLPLDNLKRIATTPWSRGGDTLGGMCRRVECQKCHRPTYAGCGQHVEQVLDDVPTNQRCDCAAKRATAKADRPKRSWFGRRPASQT